MQTKIINILKYLAYGLFVLVFAWLSYALFVGEKSVVEQEEAELKTMELLRVTYPEVAATLEPTVFTPAVRQRLINIYEPLVKTDGDLNIKSSLALSWGLIDEKTWEFNLRPGVKFHDGSGFDVEDVLYSVRRALTHPQSQLRDILSSVKGFYKIDSMTFRIETSKPDPLLLSRLSTVLIVPDGFENELRPIGTGAYQFESWEKGEVLIASKFADYWGAPAKFGEVKILTRSDKSQRVNEFIAGESDLLAFVPFEALEPLAERGYQMLTIPNLEVQFLLFNFDSPFVGRDLARKAFSLAIDQVSLVEKLGDFVVPINQFVSNGVFGFNPNLDEHVFNVKRSREYFEQSGVKGKTLKLHLQKGLDVLGEHVRLALKDVGVNLIVSYLEPHDLMQSLQEGLADVYFLGFKSELGDSVDFFDTLIHSEGAFNVIGFEDSGVDFLIEQALTQMDSRQRRDSLQAVMQSVIDDHVVGVPLFEYETGFVANEKIQFVPRVDGLIYFDELIIN